MLVSRGVLFAGVFVAATASAAFADPQTAAQLRDKALTDPTAYNVLESLTTEIGPRPVGTPAAQRARDWGVAKLKALGFKNVHVEAFAKPSWHRDAESAAVIAPFLQKLAVIGLGNSVSTPPDGVEAEIVVLDNLNQMKAAAYTYFHGPPTVPKNSSIAANETIVRDPPIQIGLETQ